MLPSSTTPSPMRPRKWAVEGDGNGSQRQQTNSINSNTLSRYVHFNGSQNNAEESKDLIMYDSQAASFPVIPQLWSAPQPLIPCYYASLPSPQYSPFSSYMPYGSSTMMDQQQQQQHQSRKVHKTSKSDFWCAGIAQLLWTIVVIVVLGLVATLILALVVV